LVTWSGEHDGVTPDAQLFNGATFGVVEVDTGVDV